MPLVYLWITLAHGRMVQLMGFYGMAPTLLIFSTA